ncbi:MAG: hypothetical protein IKE59_06515 [Erysipelotrichaceae bacterium]|nr:hypothetical protein [Erysipelotrichaceae bacterium]
MKINVDAPVKQAEITELLESQTTPTYKCLGHTSFLKTQITFEVDNIPEGMDVVLYTKMLIKKTEYGKSIAFRVLEFGKFF